MAWPYFGLPQTYWDDPRFLVSCYQSFLAGNDPPAFVLPPVVPPPDPSVSALIHRDAEDHAGAMERLLPRGRIWILDRAKQLWRFLLGVGDELARIDQRGIDLVEEADPRTATELLHQWEGFAGLPDPCAAVPVTDADRRVALTAKLTAIGGQSVAYFIARALAMGIVVTITEHQFGFAFRCGTGLCGLPLNDTDAHFHWLIDGPTATSADDRERLICLFDRLEPSHLIRSHTWTA